MGFDRVLYCKLSNLTEQRWHYAGRRYSEHSDAIKFNEGERILARFINDRANAQIFQLTGLPFRSNPDNPLTVDNAAITLQSQSFLELEIIADNPLAKAFIHLENGEIFPIHTRVNDNPHPLVF